MNTIIGRKVEIGILKNALSSKRSELIAFMEEEELARPF